MKRLTKILTVLTLFFAISGELLAFFPPSLHIHEKTETISSDIFPLSLSLTLTLKNSDRILTDFSMNVKIDSEKYLYFYPIGLKSSLEKLDYSDFAKLFQDLDGYWWGIDPYSTTTSEILGPDFTDFLRDALEDRDSLKKLDVKDQTFSISEDSLTLEVNIKKNQENFSLPGEYTDFIEHLEKAFSHE